MTRRTNARLAGFMFLFYIAAGIAGMVLAGQARSGEGTAAKLASIAEHTPLMRISAMLTMLTAFVALALAVALYALTRDHDHDLAMLALSCRVVEGVLGAIASVAMLAQVSLAARAAGAAGADAAAANALGASLMSAQWGTVAATFFAVGSTIYSYLFLRARSIPAPLAWLGVLASVLLVVGLPLQLTEVIQAPVTSFMWMPMLVFELVFALWLLIKGVAAPAAPCSPLNQPSTVS